MFLNAFDAWSNRFADFVSKKGKVEADKYRAYGYQPPPHRWSGIKLWWRDKKMRVGMAAEGSSPKAQDDLDVNRDVTLDPAKSEGEKLRHE